MQDPFQNTRFSKVDEAPIPVGARFDPFEGADTFMPTFTSTARRATARARQVRNLVFVRDGAATALARELMAAPNGR